MSTRIPDQKTELPDEPHDPRTGPERPPCPRTWREAIWVNARRVVVFVIGMTVLVLGLAMMVLPGPGTLVVPVGLAILATEFAWAGWLLHKAKEKVGRLAPLVPFIRRKGADCEEETSEDDQRKVA